MRTAIYIEEGVTQLVLTPESDWERSALADVHKSGTEGISIHSGSFYTCHGGWYRQGSGDESLILRLNPRLSEAPHVHEGIQIPPTDPATLRRDDDGPI